MQKGCSAMEKDVFHIQDYFAKNLFFVFFLIFLFLRKYGQNCSFTIKQSNADYTTTTWEQIWEICNICYLYIDGHVCVKSKVQKYSLNHFPEWISFNSESTCQKDHQTSKNRRECMQAIVMNWTKRMHASNSYSNDTFLWHTAAR